MKSYAVSQYIKQTKLILLHLKQDCKLLFMNHDITFIVHDEECEIHKQVLSSSFKKIFKDIITENVTF